MVLEPSEQMQSYIEDCEVCCQPIQVEFSGDPSEDRVAQFTAQGTQI